MCRADLPVPIHAVQPHPSHVIVPVPVVYQSRDGKIARNIIGLLGIIGGVILFTYPYYS
jgi:hypothetical protein